MAAEYEVNIKINTQQIERELGKVNKAVNNIGKSRGGKKQPVLALPSTEMLNATLNKIQGLDKVNRKIELRQKEINKQTRDQALNIDTLVKTQDRRARLLNKINEMEAKGLNVSKLRKQLGKATNEQSARRFGSAEKEFRVLEKSIRLEQSKLRILKEQRKGFPSSPVRGTRAMMGSPAQIAAAGRQIASPIRGGLQFPGSPAYLAGRTVSRRPFGPAFPTSGISSPIRGGLQSPGSPIYLAGRTVSRRPFGPSLQTSGPSRPVAGGAMFPGSPIAIQAAKQTQLRAAKVQGSWAVALGELQETAQIFKSRDARIKKNWAIAFGELEETAQIFKSRDARIKQSWATALGALEDTAKLIKVRTEAASAGLTGQSSPVGGATNIPGSPAFLRRQRRNQKLGQIGLGAGFPLLFGGGAGSVIGGAAGGAFGSFGAQIALSAVGQMVDQFVASVMEAGKALTSVGGAADFMAEKSLFSSDTMQFRIEKLIEEGKVTEAAALMTQEMAKQVGGSGLKALKDLGDEANEMGKLFGTLMLRIQAFMARALTPLIKLINSVVGGINARSQYDQMLKEAASPEQRAQIVARADELRGTTTKTVKLQGSREKTTTKLNKLTPEIVAKLQQEFPAIIPEGAGIEATELELLRAADASSKSGNKAAKEEARLQKRLAQLEEERQKILAISAFKDKIAAAEAVSDDQLVIRLKGEQRIVEIEADRKKSLIGITKQREIDAINIGKATEKLAAQQDTERQLNALQVSRNKLFTDTVENLEHELKMAQAVTEEEKERLRIQLQLKKLQKDGLGQGQIEEIEGLLNKIAEENSPLSQAIKQTQQQINDLLDPVKQLISLADTLGNAFSESFRGLVSGSMTAREALANLFQRTADHFLDMAAQMIAAQIKMQILNIGLNFFGGMGSSGLKALPGSAPQMTQNAIVTPTGFSGQFGGMAALGGSVTKGNSYIVGERGPELFVPGAQGNIVPNNAMGSANVTVNVDASGSSVEGDSAQASQLGKMLGAAVQAELIKQKRPGGLLAS